MTSPPAEGIRTILRNWLFSFFTTVSERDGQFVGRGSKNDMSRGEGRKKEEGLGKKHKQNAFRSNHFSRGNNQQTSQKDAA